MREVLLTDEQMALLVEALEALRQQERHIPENIYRRKAIEALIEEFGGAAKI